VQERAVLARDVNTPVVHVNLFDANAPIAVAAVKIVFDTQTKGVTEIRE